MKKKNICFNHTQYKRFQHLFGPDDWIFYPQNNLNFFLYMHFWLFYLFIYIVYLFTYLFIQLFLYLFFIYLSTTEHKAPHFSFFVYMSLCLSLPRSLSLCVHMSLLVRLFVSIFLPLVCFLPKCLSVSVSLSMFVCLFDCCNSPVIIFAKCLYCYCQFWFCNTTVTFINHHPSFFISFFHPSNGDEKMKFILSSSGMVFPYLSVVWVNRLSINYFVLSILQCFP